MIDRLDWIHISHVNYSIFRQRLAQHDDSLEILPWNSTPAPGKLLYIGLSFVMMPLIDFVKIFSDISSLFARRPPPRALHKQSTFIPTKHCSSSRSNQEDTRRKTCFEMLTNYFRLRASNEDSRRFHNHREGLY